MTVAYPMPGYRSGGRGRGRGFQSAPPGHRRGHADRRHGGGWRRPPRSFPGPKGIPSGLALGARFAARLFPIGAAAVTAYELWRWYNREGAPGLGGNWEKCFECAGCNATNIAWTDMTGSGCTDSWATCICNTSWSRTEIDPATDDLSAYQRIMKLAWRPFLGSRRWDFLEGWYRVDNQPGEDWKEGTEPMPVPAPEPLQHPEPLNDPHATPPGRPRPLPRRSPRPWPTRTPSNPWRHPWEQPHRGPRPRPRPRPSPGTEVFPDPGTEHVPEHALARPARGTREIKLRLAVPQAMDNVLRPLTEGLDWLYCLYRSLPKEFKYRRFPTPQRAVLAIWRFLGAQGKWRLDDDFGGGRWHKAGQEPAEYLASALVVCGRAQAMDQLFGFIGSGIARHWGAQMTRYGMSGTGIQFGPALGDYAYLNRPSPHRQHLLEHLWENDEEP